MTEEEKKRLIIAKHDVSEQLAGIHIEDYRLSYVDDRLNVYTREVAKHPERHNLWEQLAVLRFFRMCDRYGINATEVHMFFKFYESLYFPGTKGLQRYRLTPVQAFQYASIYGFWDNGRRVTREAVLFVPRKFSKTTSSAAIAVYDLLYGDSNAESYTGANSQDQAKKCFDVIRGGVRKLDPRGLRYVVNEQVIKSRRKDRTAIAQCLTANARTKDGLNASTVIMDEFSQARDNLLLTVLTTSMGIRVNPLTVIITTASDVFDGPFYDMLQGYKRLLLGDYDDDSVFAHLFEPDIDDPEDSEDTWRKVHPHMGVTVSMDFYRQEWKNAQRNGADAKLAFKTKLLNIYAENETRSWISATLARSIAIHIDLDTLQGRPHAMVAIDLSESRDFSAVTIGFYQPQGRQYHFHTAYFFPRGALPGHPNELLYRKWADDGHLILLGGAVIDYRYIVEYIVGLSRRATILGIGFDPWKSKDVVNMLATIGGEESMVQVRQTYGEFTSAVESFEHGVHTGHVFINDNPINYYCFGNAVLDFDKLENCKPIKRQDNHRIDGVITMLMCKKMFIDYVS